MRRLVGACTAGVLLAAGCAWFVAKEPGSCYSVRLVPARMFAVEAPATASANATLSLVPWVSRLAPLTKLDQLATQSFQAAVDAEARTITVTGQVFRTEAAPGSGCSYPTIAVLPEPASVSLEVTAPAGTYSLVIPDSAFISERPTATASLPAAAATRSLVLE